ncbi:MAG: hypothetical protein J1F01_04165 [Oscillospiraceae bacterium]|nr:hypothetical protein [Oscillospiraceae bacterium]
MNTAYVYLQLYRLFDDVTPVEVDCGMLCGKACCKGDDSGMFLFPGEKEVFKLLNPDWIKIDKTDFYYEYDGKKHNVPIAFCSGKCDRYQRPLACRIFPLTPYLNEEGKIEIITDPRAKSVCPLAKAFLHEDYDSVFIKNIKKAFILLAKNKQFYEFLKEYSKYIDEFKRFFI